MSDCTPPVSEREAGLCFERNEQKSDRGGDAALTCDAWTRSYSDTQQFGPTFELGPYWFARFTDLESEASYIANQRKAVRKAAILSLLFIMVLMMIGVSNQYIWAADRDIVDEVVALISLSRLTVTVFFAAVMLWGKFGVEVPMLTLLHFLSASVLVANQHFLSNAFGFTSKQQQSEGTACDIDPTSQLCFAGLVAVACVTQMRPLYLLTLPVFQVSGIICLAATDWTVHTSTHLLTWACSHAILSSLLWQVDYTCDILSRQRFGYIQKLNAVMASKSLSERRASDTQDFLEIYEQAQEIQELIRQAIAEGDNEALLSNSQRLVDCGWTVDEVDRHIKWQEKSQSERGGISLTYLVSNEFFELARTMTGEADPSFYDLKDVFFLGDDAIGKHVRCPRDGLQGCALIDALPRKFRGACTHYLSWTWAYTVTMFQSSLTEWLRRETNLQSHQAFLFVCFFCNNQYRLIVDGSANGSDHLEDIFEERLERISHMVAMLDTWDAPVYLSRIWTIYEQFCSTKLRIHVTMLLPPQAHGSLIGMLEKGKTGIEQVTRSMMNVDSECATAYFRADEVKVKHLIRTTIGFSAVNRAVSKSLISWVGDVVRVHFDKLIHGKPPLSLSSLRCPIEVLDDDKETQGELQAWAQELVAPQLNRRRADAKSLYEDIKKRTKMPAGFGINSWGGT